nr:capsule biosynthesis protein [Paracoccus sp. S-4012]
MPQPGGAHGGPPQAPPLPPPASAARPRRRHWMLLASFIVLVLLPVATAAWYLWTRAADQYVSSMAFSVRREDQRSGVDLLGGITAFATSTAASDVNILEDYIGSPDMVQAVMERVDLPAEMARHWPRDFIYAYDPDGTIEDLVDYWNRQVTVINDDKTGIMTVRVAAFSPEDAQLIAQTVFDASSATVNRLSDQAREDATRYAREELDKAEARVRELQDQMTAFRTRTQIVDPQAEFASRLEVVAALQGQLAEALVAQDLLLENGARPQDPRVVQGEMRIGAIENRIEAERNRISTADAPGGASYATMVAEFERLAADRTFAEEALVATRAAYDLALAEARRQTRYLAAHIAPNLPQQSLRPDRPLVLAIFAGFALLAWSILALVYYSVRDRG